MSLSEKELEKHLLKAGQDLLDPSPSALFAYRPVPFLLSKLSLYLSDVEHDPSSSIKNALSQSIQALGTAQYFNHLDAYVKVGVTACICKIMRIIAPDVPYDDEKMKEVFQFIVSSFEKLSAMDTCHYVKTILEVVAKARVSVMMLDLGCDAFVVDMFQHFLKVIRDDHPVRVFLFMETIMTVVLEESKDIPPELLSLILDYVKKDDEVSQGSRRLAEQVLSRCASKLKTCLTEAVEACGVSLDKYCNVVASICEDSQDPREAAVKDNQKAAEVSTPEQTCDHVAISSINKNGHEAVSRRHETVAGVKTHEKRSHEMVEVPVAEEEDHVEAETGTHKRARVESCSLHEADGEMKKTTAAEGEHSRRNHISNAELEHKKLPQPCSVSDQLAKVKQSIVDTITSVSQFRFELETKEQSIVDIVTSVRQFQSEIKRKEDNLEASLQEVDVLGEKILGINKILNS